MTLPLVCLVAFAAPLPWVMLDSSNAAEARETLAPESVHISDFTVSGASGMLVEVSETAVYQGIMPT
jgi:hypothetical protein